MKIDNVHSKTFTTGDINDVEFANAIDISIHDGIQGLKEIWENVQSNSPISVYQRYGWIEEYLKATMLSNKIKPFIAVGKFNGEVVFILPFAITGKIIKRIQFIGGSHVNFNLGIFPSFYAPLMTKYTMRVIFKRIASLTPGMGYMKLCCQPTEWRNELNPLLHLPNQLSANPAFILNLEGGFDETLARGNAKRKRKKFRQQCRMAEGLGGYELVIPETESDIDKIVSIFFEQKSERLKRLGIPDVFSDESINQFVSSMARNSFDRNDPLLRLYALKVGDDIIAVFGGGVFEGRLSGYFSSIDMNKHVSLSPGEMLLYLVVQDSCERGYTQMDLGAGEERYKKSWSSEVIQMYDIIMPLSFVSLPIVTLRRLYGEFRRYCRTNQKIWGAFKKARLYKAKYLPL